MKASKILSNRILAIGIASIFSVLFSSSEAQHISARQLLAKGEAYLAPIFSGSRKLSDLVQAKQSLEQAHEKGDSIIKARACVYLGYLLSYAFGDIERDFIKAYEYFSFAAKQNDDAESKMRGICGLGWVHYYDDKGSYDNKKCAHDYFKQAAHQESDVIAKARASCMLGMIYYYGEGAAIDKALARSYFEYAAMQTKDPWAQARSVNFICLMEELAGNDKEALHCEQFLANQYADFLSTVVAQLNLGKRSYFGKGVEIDKAAAKAYFEGAYNQDVHRDAKAQASFYLGLIYTLGESVKINEALALKYFEYAAREASEMWVKAQASVYIGYLCAANRGVPQDIERARKCLEYAANQSDEWAKHRALFHLGELYYCGLGVAKDFAKARVYLEQAASDTDAWTRNKALEILASMDKA